MLRNNSIPRRLIGAGGIRLFDIEGLVYPQKMLRQKEKSAAEEVAPEWGISTVEAAEILGCRASSARLILDKMGVKKIKVKREGLPPTWYWHRSQVESVAASRRSEVRSVPERYMTAREVSEMLQISRSTLFRYVRDGVLAAHCVRHRTEQGIRLKHFFKRDDVRRLLYHLNALKIRQLNDPAGDAGAGGGKK